MKFDYSEDHKRYRVRNTGRFNIYLVTVRGRRLKLRPSRIATIWQNENNRIVRAVLS